MFLREFSRVRARKETSCLKILLNFADNCVQRSESDCNGKEKELDASCNPEPASRADVELMKLEEPRDVPAYL